MARRMACSLTIDAVRARIKTETRRAANTWTTLLPGDPLVLIEKGMGLPKGSHQVELAHVVVDDVVVERLSAITLDGVRREGFDPDEWTPTTWCLWWKKQHGVFITEDPLVRVIRWYYE